MTVKTKQVMGRREVHFNCENCLLADARAIAENADAYEAIGNWSIGENFSHVAKAMTSCVNGFEFKLPFAIRMAGKLLKSKMLSKPLDAGFKLSADAAKAIGPDEGISTADGFKQLEEAVALFQSTDKRCPSPLLGELSAKEWVDFQCRHAEMHFSFIRKK